ncbi:MAG: hypoxanthine phosphoribosyltransferase [Bacteroidia bacterium]|nr:hypoxanthine phosphoribosyltransferase [Bacteroidia bacterium]
MEILQLNNKPFKSYISSIEIAESCTKMANQINSDYKNKRPLFLAVLNGSFIFAADLFRKINLPSDISFVKIASYSGTNSTEKINNLIGINENIEGRDIIIIEDIVDTGNTLHYLFEILKEKKANTIQIATLLFKPEAYKWNYPVQYVGKTIPNVFVVGYGLDYDGFGRNLNSIYILNEK